MDRLDEFFLGCCGKNHRSYSRGMHSPTLTHRTQGSSFATGLEVSEKRKRVLVISTGSKNVDGILGGQHVFLVMNAASHFVLGGIMSQSISEGDVRE